jgi:beta-alanine--pyruvate transaminase
VFLECWQRGVLIRTTGDTIAALAAADRREQAIDQIVGTLGRRAEDDP